MPQPLNNISFNSLNKSDFVLILLLSAILIYNLIFRDNYSIPLGFDEIISIWPVGNELVESNLVEWPNIIFSRFLSEDHIFPITNFFAFLVIKLNGDVVENLYWISRFAYLIIFILSVLVFNEFCNSKSNIIFFAILFLNSGTLGFGILSYNLNFNLVCIFSLAALLFFLRAQSGKFISINYILFLIASLLGTFTSENFYVVFPAILIVFLSNKEFLFKRINWIALTIFSLILICKFWVSYIFIGQIMPSSRLGPSGFNLLKNGGGVVAKVLNEIFLGIPLYLFLWNRIIAFISASIIGILSFYFFKKRKLSGNKLLCTLTLSLLPFVAYTGRFHPGMWTFVVIIGIFFISSILSGIFQNKGSFVVYSSLSLFLVFINIPINAYSTFKAFYKESSENSIVSYKLISPKTQKLLIYNLASYEPILHPIPFWIGYKIFNKKKGLVFSKFDNSIHMYGIDIETLNFDKKDSLCYINLTKDKNVSTIVNTSNSTFSLKYTDSIKFEYSILEKYRSDLFQQYDFINPFIIKGSLDTFKVKILTNDLINRKPNIKFLKANTFNFQYSNNCIQFEFIGSFPKDKLVLNNVYFAINSIIITNPNGYSFSKNTNEEIGIVADKRAFYSIQSKNMLSFGNFEGLGGKKLVIFPKSVKELANVTFWYFNKNSNKWAIFKKKDISLVKGVTIQFIDNKIYVYQNKKRSEYL